MVPIDTPKTLSATMTYRAIPSRFFFVPRRSSHSNAYATSPATSRGVADGAFFLALDGRLVFRCAKSPPGAFCPGLTKCATAAIEVAHQDQPPDANHGPVYLVGDDAPGFGEHGLARRPNSHSHPGAEVTSESVRVVALVQLQGVEGAGERVNGDSGQRIGRNLTIRGHEPGRAHAKRQVEVVAVERRVFELDELRERRPLECDLTLQPERAPAQPAEVQERADLRPLARSFQLRETAMDPKSGNRREPEVRYGFLRAADQRQHGNQGAKP